MRLDASVILRAPGKCRYTLYPPLSSEKQSVNYCEKRTPLAQEESTPITGDGQSISRWNLHNKPCWSSLCPPLLSPVYFLCTFSQFTGPGPNLSSAFLQYITKGLTVPLELPVCFYKTPCVTLKKIQRAGELAKWLRMLAALQWTRVQFPAPMSGGTHPPETSAPEDQTPFSDSLFWSPWVHV